MSKIRYPCMCGALDCRRCYPSHTAKDEDLEAGTCSRCGETHYHYFELVPDENQCEDCGAYVCDACLPEATNQDMICDYCWEAENPTFSVPDWMLERMINTFIPIGKPGGCKYILCYDSHSRIHEVHNILRSIAEMREDRRCKRII